MNKKLVYALSLLLTGMLFTGCKNGDADFPDYEGGTTAYFAYQYPVRTIIFADEDYDTTLDQNHQCMIKSTFGGSYGTSNGTVTVAVDNSLVNNLTFEDGTPVKAMPENYYTLESTTWGYKGTMNGGTIVNLTDAFFNDPDASTTTYVIPLVMTGQTGFGKIATGELKEGGTPIRTDESQWEVLPMDYVLYCVKYQNKYAGYWLTRGTTDIDNIEKAGNVQLKCKTMNSCIYTITQTFSDWEQYVRDENGEIKKDDNNNPLTEKVTKTLSIDMLVTFDANEQCTITSASAGVTVNGSGSWEDNGAKKSWNNKDRDLMELSYNFATADELGNAHTGSVHEKMVYYRTGITTTEFKPTYNK